MDGRYPRKAPRRTVKAKYLHAREHLLSLARIPAYAGMASK